MAETPTTELEAVNIMLGCAQFSQVNTLVGTLTPDVNKAVAILKEINRAVQTEGWFFNSEEDYPFTANGSGEIVLPANILEIDFKPYNHWKYEVVQRGTKLYDKKAHSFTFDQGVTFKADIVLHLPFTDLPEVARYYITIRAAKTFQARTIGDRELDGFTRADEGDARSNLERWESEQGDYNIFNNGDTATITNRAYGLATLLPR